MGRDTNEKQTKSNGSRYEERKTNEIKWVAIQTKSNGFNLLGFGWFIGLGLSILKKKTNPREAEPSKLCASISSSSLFVHHRYRNFDPPLYNQYPTTSPSINLSFMSSFRLAFSLLLYILFISFEWKPKPELLSLIYGDQTEWKIPGYLRSRWQNHAFPRCHTGSPRNPAAFPLDSFLGGLKPSKEDAYWPWDASNRRAGIWFHPT